MERIRLTQRTANRSRQANSAAPETSIDLGKDRNYRKIDEYHTFEQSLNHEEPDMRHEWKDNPREETGHGIPKMAKVYMAAKKATKLAMMLLGEDAKEATLEKQARAFMRMGDKALTASIERWAECNCETGDEKCCADEEALAPAEEAPAPAPEASEEEAPAAPVEEAPVEEAPADVEVQDEPVNTDVSFDDDIDETDGDANVKLEACFADEGEGEEEVSLDEKAPVASKKVGLKKLAGQPTLVRVASKNADDLVKLSNCWKWSD